MKLMKKVSSEYELFAPLIEEEINKLLRRSKCFHSLFEPWQPHHSFNTTDKISRNARGYSRRYTVTEVFFALKKGITDVT